jgi:hypothetical protein
MASASMHGLPYRALARDLPETALHVASRRPTTQPSAASLTWAAMWTREVLQGVVNHLRINGMQGVRGSNPLSSTPGHRPSPPLTASESWRSRSRYAATTRAITRQEGPSTVRCEGHVEVDLDLVAELEGAKERRVGPDSPSALDDTRATNDPAIGHTALHQDRSGHAHDC